MREQLVYAHIEDIAKRLHDPNKYGSASIMVGAGFSKNAIVKNNFGTPPNWSELSAEMFKKIYKKPVGIDEIQNWNQTLLYKTSGRNALKLAEEYMVTFGRNSLDALIEESIKDDQYLPCELHMKLLELDWDDVFTTNYDTLLERSIGQISFTKNYKVLLSQEDLPGKTRPRIIKLHGSIPHSRPYIICEEDYRRYPNDYAPFVNTVQNQC